MSVPESTRTDPNAQNSKAQSARLLGKEQTSRKRVNGLVNPSIWMPFGIVVVAVAVWEICVRLFNVPVSILPSPSSIISALFENWERLAADSMSTLWTIILSFAISVIVGVGFGALIGLSKRLSTAIYPLLVTSQAVPKIAIAPVMIVWFGYGELSKTMLTILMTFFPIVLNTAHGLASLEGGYVNLARSMGASQWELLWKFRVPYALPEIYSGLKLGIIFAVVGAVVGEFVASNTGLGFTIITEIGYFHTPIVFAALLILTLFGIVSFYLMVWLEHSTTGWWQATRK